MFDLQPGPAPGILYLPRTLLCYGGDHSKARKQRKMESWKALGIVLLALTGTQAVAAEDANPFAKGMMITTFLPTILIGGITSLTTEPPKIFKSAKTDALAYIGSGGEIRGAEFEQASRYYRSIYSPPLMSDHQLALAIATSL